MLGMVPQTARDKAINRAAERIVRIINGGEVGLKRVLEELVEEVLSMSDPLRRELTYEEWEELVSEPPDGWERRLRG